MTLNARLRFAGLLACVLVLAAWRSPPPPPPPPPPPQPAPFNLAPGIIEQAAAYADYMAKAGAINPNFTSGADVSDAVKFGDSYDVAGFQRGEIAYGAVAALQDPNFVATIRAYGSDPEARASLAADIFANPRFVLGVNGADNAAGLVIAALMGQGKKLMATGAAVRQAAYDVQHQAWSTQVVPDRERRLAAAKGAIGFGAPASPDEVAQMSQEAQGFSPVDISGPAASQPYPPLVIDSLALAALAALGEAGEDHMDKLASMLSEPLGQTCLTRVKASLYECLAVSKPYYEDVFCLGQHVLADTGQCVMIDAGAPAPLGTIIPPTPAATPASAKPTHKKKGKRG
jgi:hypothetical protein